MRDFYCVLCFFRQLLLYGGSCFFIFFLGSVRGCSGERSENRRLRLVEGAQDAAAAEDPA